LKKTDQEPSAETVKMKVEFTWTNAKKNWWQHCQRGPLLSTRSYRKRQRQSKTVGWRIIVCGL